MSSVFNCVIFEFVLFLFFSSCWCFACFCQVVWNLCTSLKSPSQFVWIQINVKLFARRRPTSAEIRWRGSTDGCSVHAPWNDPMVSEPLIPQPRSELIPSLIMSQSLPRKHCFCDVSQSCLRTVGSLQAPLCCWWITNQEMHSPLLVCFPFE